MLRIAAGHKLADGKMSACPTCGLSSRGSHLRWLGLYIVRSIVEAHGGAIHVEDAPKGGAEFVVTLPLEQSAPPWPPLTGEDAWQILRLKSDERTRSVGSL
jgi:hypothetical protein